MQCWDCICIEYGPTSSSVPSNLWWSGGGGFDTSSRPGFTIRYVGFSFDMMSLFIGPRPFAFAVIMWRTRPYWQRS